MGAIKLKRGTRFNVQPNRIPLSKRLLWRLVRSLHLHFHLCAAFCEHINIALIGESIVSAFSRTNTDDILDGINKDQPIADASSLCRLPDGLDGLFHIVIAEDNVELNARKEIHPVCTGPPGQLDAALTAMSAHLAHVHADDPD